MKYTFISIIIMVMIGLIVKQQLINKTTKTTPAIHLTNTAKITMPLKYIALGDSYTYGQGETEEDSFPRQLVDKLREDHIDIELVANPSVSGYTTQDLINEELDVLKSRDVNFVTLLIGANDVAQRVDKETFRKNFKYILDQIITKTQNKNSVIIMTIPDFSLTPLAKQDGAGLPVSETIEEFNTIIEDEAKNHGINVVDLFEITKEMGTDSSLINRDDLHPSAKEYAKWIQLLLPEVKKIVQKP